MANIFSRPTVASEIGKELHRRSIQGILLLFFLLYSYFSGPIEKGSGLFVYITVLILLFIVEFLRLELNMNMPLMPIRRSREKEGMHGSVYFQSALIICYAAFEYRIALAVLMMTYLGDMAATVIGRRFGTTMFLRDQTALGAISMLAANILIGLAIMSTYQLFIILAVAVAATFVNIIVEEIDENLFVPLIAGSVGHILTMIF